MSKVKTPAHIVPHVYEGRFSGRCSLWERSCYQSNFSYLGTKGKVTRYFYSISAYVFCAKDMETRVTLQMALTVTSFLNAVFSDRAEDITDVSTFVLPSH